MSLFVNTNVSALNAQRQLINSGNGLSQAFQRLSSGFRINSAADDAAGLQISNRLTGQINGLNQGISNANDGISLVQVAEGAMDEITNALQRMRVLSVQAENGINSPRDKLALQKEVNALIEEISRIATTTEFGGNKLLDGTYSTTFLVGANSDEANKIPVDLTKTDGFGSIGLWVSQIDVTAPKSQDSGTFSDPGVIRNGTAGQQFSNVPISTDGHTIPAFRISIDDDDFIRVPSYTIPVGYDRQQAAQLFINKVHQATGQTLFSPANVLGDISYAKDVSLRFRTDEVAPDAAIGAANVMAFEDIGMPAAWIGVPAIGTTDYNTSIIDRAIQQVDGARADLGAIQNRFQSTIRNLSNNTENLSAARSRIRDTDFAKETAELTRQQILQQAGTTILSQANQRPQAALNLLG